MNKPGQNIKDYAFDQEHVESTRRDGNRRLNIYQLPEPCIVLGRGSAIHTEIRYEVCRADNIQLYRRRGGGCAVLIDRGNLVVAVTVPRLPQDRSLQIGHMFSRFSLWLIKGLDIAGISNITSRGISDMTYKERKVGGACLYIDLNVLYYSTTLLITPDPTLMTKYLKHPPREPEYRQCRKHEDFVMGLATIFPGLTPVSVKETLETALGPPTLKNNC